MKTKTLLFTFFAMVTFTMSAQTDYSSYLNKAMEKLEAGDCAGAQKIYNVYKELSGKSMSSVEILLADCNQDVTNSIGDSITVGDVKYQVAYVRDGGKHGLAIRNMGWSDIYSNGRKQQYVTRKGIPTLDELKLIYANRDILRLYDIYWSCTSCTSCNHSEYYMTKDFSTGLERGIDEDYPNAIVLLIHRF